MKSLVPKFIKLWLNKINLSKQKKHLNKTTVLIAAAIISFLVIFSYFIRPFYFDYDVKKKNLENKINNTFKIKAKLAIKPAPL